MLTKIAGGVLLVVGGVLALKLLLGFVWALLSVLLVAAAIYVGWRLMTK